MSCVCLPRAVRQRKSPASSSSLFRQSIATLPTSTKSSACATAPRRPRSRSITACPVSQRGVSLRLFDDVLFPGSQVSRMASVCAVPSLPGMTSTTAMNGATTKSPPRTDFVALARELGPVFASRAAAHDANDSFPVDNYRELKELQFFSAGVPTELGGGGASHRELCAMLRVLGHHCGATGLALSMHTHLVGTTVWLWRQGAPVAPLLERIAKEQLVLVTNGASDWLDSSGVAERVDGGFRITGRKFFASGSAAADVLITS